MTRPTRLSAKVFLELPPVLAHYLHSDRTQHFDARPGKGKITFQERWGLFRDVESWAVERRQQLQLLGEERTRLLAFRVGFEQGCRDAARHYQQYDQNARLALQAGVVFFQVQGMGAVEQTKFEFDVETRTLYRELRITGCLEAAMHRVATESRDGTACWQTAGYFSGHVSELVGRKVLTYQTACESRGDSECRFVSHFEGEWGSEADWMRRALAMEPLETELSRRDRLVATAQGAARRAQQALNDLQRRMREDRSLHTFIAASDAMAAAVKKAEQFAPSDSPVVLVGEPGCGREMLARAIHAASARRDGPFVLLDCVGQSPEQLRIVLGNRGMAHSTLPSPLEQAQGGTLYLNDLGALPLEAQGLLYTIMSAALNGPTPPGAGERAFPRIIAACHEAPEKLRAEGKLRDDLYYLLAVGSITLPPLRDRGVDILMLAGELTAQIGARYGRTLILSQGCKEALMHCSWPGNIRQLRQAIEHAALMAEGETLEAGHLPADILAIRAKPGPKELSKEVIAAALEKTKGNRSHAADLLGIGRTTLWRAMKRFELA